MNELFDALDRYGTLQHAADDRPVPDRQLHVDGRELLHFGNPRRSTAWRLLFDVANVRPFPRGAAVVAMTTTTLGHLSVLPISRPQAIW